MTSESDWNAVGQRWLDDQPQRLWRRLHNELNLSLLSGWARSPARGRVLKTDLFDEVVGDGLLPWFRDDAIQVGMDCATTVVVRARRGGRSVLAADTRRLPFRTASYDLVVSNSTLDHFESEDELRRSLGEIRRILSPGGRLLLTMDNLANPVVALRNRLPFRLLRALGIIPYPMGVSGGPRMLRRALEDQGFDVVEVRALSHVPRLPAVLVAGWLDRAGLDRPRAWFRRFVLAWESLERLPTRFRTGYYVALLAEAPGDKVPIDKVPIDKVPVDRVPIDEVAAQDGTS